MAGLSKKQQLKVIPDSIKEALKVAREYGMQLNGDHSARAIGMIRPNEQKDEEHLLSVMTESRDIHHKEDSRNYYGCNLFSSHLLQE